MAHLPDEAFFEHKKSLEIKRKLCSLDASSTRWERDLGLALRHSCEAELARGNLTLAEEAASESIRIANRLSESDPSNAIWARDISTCELTIGKLLYAKRDYSGSLAAYTRSFASMAGQDTRVAHNEAVLSQLYEYGTLLANVSACTRPAKPSLAAHRESPAARSCQARVCGCRDT